MSPRPSRKVHLKAGPRGRTVRVVEGTHRGAEVYWVEHRTADGRRTAAPFPRTRVGRAEAMAYADGVLARQQRGPSPEAPHRMTVEEVWRAYVAAEFPAFRPNTHRIYRDGWRPWAEFVGPHTVAEDLGTQSMAGLRSALEARGWAVNTISKTFGVIRGVYNWAEEHELIQRNRVSRYRYKVAKDKRPKSPAEYRTEDLVAILAQLPLDYGNKWRAHAVVAICGNQGARSWAALHLQWADVDLEAGRIIWRAAWDKNGTEWSQPLRHATRAVLVMADYWRQLAGYEGPWVFFPGSRRNRGAVYTQGAALAALKTAEQRAGIPHQRGRGLHGFRRMLSGDVNDLTGNVKLALEAIGDSDIRMAKRYLKPRKDRLAAVFEQLDRAEPATHLQAASEGADDAD